MLFAFNFANAQNKKAKLQADIIRLEKEIAYTNNLLETTRKSKSNSLEELVLLNNKINQRGKLISSIKKEIKELNTSIGKSNREIKELNKDLKQLKEEYGKMVYYAYKNKNSADRLMFVFSAESFNQAYQRLKYLQYYSSYRKNQAALIEQTKDTLNKKLILLETQKSSKTVLIFNQQKELAQLGEEKSQKRTMINRLGRKEKDLRASLRKKRREAERLNKAIENIITDEIKLAATKKNAVKRKASIAMTPDEHIVSNLFSNNKGLLPWPSARGVVSSTFGEHSHPILKKVKVRNNGIDILTTRGEKARTVFDGTVISVRTITNTNRVVIIRHGEYFTVYSNLSKVLVRQGDKVKTKQEIGFINTDQKNSKTELHFEIWKGKTRLNPSRWIAKIKKY
jgi:septal ring factor EnvC (AmiA/AmiB activator)